MPDVKRLIVSKQIIEQTYKHFREYGTRGLEGFVLWNGTINSNNQAVVTEAYIPLQHSVSTNYGLSVTIPGEALHKLNVHLHKTQLKLIAQVHSHPDEAYHSAVDDFFPVATQIGSLSIVIPSFGAIPFSSQNCAVYRLSSTNKWIQPSPDEIAALITVDAVWLSSFFQNLSSELCGSLPLLFLIELFLTHGKELQSLNQELRSRNKEVARLAIERTRMNGMLFDGSFIRQYFGRANWEDADLSGAVLSHASLMQVNLKGANLKDAKVDDVDFTAVELSEKTILPDGRYWSPEIDIMNYARK